MPPCRGAGGPDSPRAASGEPGKEYAPGALGCDISGGDEAARLMDHTAIDGPRTYRLALQGEVESGRTIPFRFQVLGPDGKAVNAYRRLHDRELHLIVVRHDRPPSLTCTLRERSTARGPSTSPLPSPGAYRVFVDFAPEGGPRLALAAASPLLESGPNRRCPHPRGLRGQCGYRVEATAAWRPGLPPRSPSPSRATPDRSCRSLT